MNKKYILLFLIIALAFFLRVYKVSEYPAGLNADEAAIGYNAYSLIQTGKDEFGHSWPLTFQSFNDFKPGIYFYLVLPFVKIFGLNELAVRLPSVILGTLTVLVLYFLVKKIFSSSLLAISSSFLLAISPWHLHFSRGGWESNASLFFIIAGVYFFFRSFNKHRLIVLSSFFFILSMYTYHSARLISPLLLLGMAVLYRKNVFTKENSKHFLITIICGMLLLFLLAKSLVSSGGTSRFSGVGIFADQGPFWRANELRGQHINRDSFFPKIIHNRYFEYGMQFINNYLKHYNGNFLFISGDEIQRNKVPEMGQLYLVEIPFFVLGLYYLIKKKPNGWKFLLWWLAIAPVASALTFQSPHAIRSLNMIVPLVIVTAYGLDNAIEWIKGKRFNKTMYLLLVSFFVWNFSFYLHQYYVHYSKIYPAAWEDGFRELVSYVSANQERFEKIIVTDKYDQPYILFAFYLKYPPAVFQTEAKLTEKDQYGFSTVPGFGKYSFWKINYEEAKNQRKTMIIGAPSEIPDSATIVKRIYYKDGKTEAFRIIEN